MPRNCSPNWLDQYLEYTAYKESPEKYHLWTGISILAQALRRNVYVDQGYFKIFPNFYIALIGPTGFGKTSAADIGIDFIRQVPEIELMEEKVTSWYIAQFFGDITKAGKDCAVSLYAPEMKTFLGDLNKTELITMLTSFYGCPTHSAIRLKHEGKQEFKNVCLNLLACSTPEWLTLGTTTDEIAGGFTGRFVYVFEDTMTRNFAFPADHIKPETLALRKPLLEDLIQISQLQGEFLLTDQAKGEYILWYNTRMNECTDERLTPYYARKRDLVLKLAMILSVSQDDSRIIDEQILQTSFVILTQVEEKMKESFAGVVDDPALKYKDMVVSQLAKAPDQSMTKADLLRKNWNRFDHQVLDRIIQNLEESGMLQIGAKKMQQGTTPLYKLISI